MSLVTSFIVSLSFIHVYVQHIFVENQLYSIPGACGTIVMNEIYVYVPPYIVPKDFTI